MKLRLFAPVRFNLSSAPVYNPVLANSALRVKLEFNLAVTPFIRAAWRKYFDYKLRRSMMFPIRFKRSRQARLAGPHKIGRYIIVFGKDYPRRKGDLSLTCLSAPKLKVEIKIRAGRLMDRKSTRLNSSHRT